MRLPGSQGHSGTSCSFQAHKFQPGTKLIPEKGFTPPFTHSTKGCAGHDEDSREQGGPPSALKELTVRWERQTLTK